MSDGFEGVLRHIRSIADTEAQKGRLFVDTGDEWGPNARRTILGLKPECQVLRFGDLAGRPVDWPDLVRSQPEDLGWRQEPYSLRPHQQAAFDDVTGRFADHGRGKLVMACGTGKTFTALRIAEEVAGVGGRVLYLVPSISLLQQSMREWAEQRAVPHGYIGICSDTRAGSNDEDATIEELEIPVTTDPEAISKALRAGRTDAMTVVFSTYHSLGIVAAAQDDGAPRFDIVLCDEAHRTTGIDKPGDKTSPFVLVHDGARIRAERRLYMTATPRLYTQAARTKAARHDVEVFSMDDEATYGLLPEGERADAYRCEVKHVDGRHNALDRKARIEWLKGDSPGGCRILSNARCLSEGIDVPALDAVLFMSSRNSPTTSPPFISRRRSTAGAGEREVTSHSRASCSPTRSTCIPEGPPDSRRNGCPTTANGWRGSRTRRSK